MESVTVRYTDNSDLLIEHRAMPFEMVIDKALDEEIAMVIASMLSKY